MEERKTEEFEDDRGKWKIYFDIEKDHERGTSHVLVSFVSNKKESRYLTKEGLEKLKQDLKDLGKLRIIKQGKGFLER